MAQPRLVLLLIVAVVAGVVGFIVGKNRSGTLSLPSTLSSYPQSAAADVNNLTYQSATVRGQVAAVDGSNLQVKDGQGQLASLAVAKSVAIYKSSSPSADLKTIETGKEVTLNLQLIDGQMQVVSVIYPLTTTKK